MSDELQTMSDAIAESVAASLCEFNHKLLFTGLDPDELLQCALEVFAKKVPGFVDAPQESLQLFADRLGIALCNRMLIENDMEVLRRSGLRPQ
jgi:hypothetical protein